MDWLRVVAGVGGVAHIAFAVIEMFFWGRWLVDRVAPSWIDAQTTQDHIDWAARLARNVGAYNLALAVGLLWVAHRGAEVAGTLGLFLAIWLLVAAAAAGITGVYRAMGMQGVLGIALLLLCL